MAEVKKLIEGYKNFYKENFITNKNNLFKDVQNSQNPKTLVICCSDSRVDPAILMNSDIGDIFVVRNVANLVPPYQPNFNSSHGTSAAIEFAVNYLKVEHIVVLGHSNCGGIKSLVDNDIDMNEKFSFITEWVKIAEGIKTKITTDIEDKYAFCEQEGIKLSLNNLMTFPWVKAKVEKGDLKLHGWYFLLKDASLSTLNKDTEMFEKIKI
ncbi:MAG: carbonic anhydrase [Alphaproteobacteria bacterium]|nr:carbonic anhydrase [Alphaproteobacteria bacterium]MBN2674857.1 carbonic anhydrase [Alphaproteobacteria bacterium]